MASKSSRAAAPDAEAFLPRDRRRRDDLKSLRRAAAKCEACPLYRDASETVFGEGPKSARAVLIGETPGDQEDRQGAVFVGPAGRLLDKALAEAGLERSELYLTNAVKHFKFTYKGKRRIHETPDAGEIRACRPWVLAELEAVDPELVVIMGAVAARSLLGSSFRVTKERGQVLEPSSGVLDGRDLRVVVTVHPSAVLRADDRVKAFEGFVGDLEVAAGALKSG
ncbi:UdgX family uracil-DNA binding protein [Spirillospora sp. NPDC047279]|uniref:UdgX family uracil-DNA binding protein n=1 Tax=Spirillospora sp. NPDC047279 TaxID=3155478 RepID=UPI003403F20A